MTVARLPDRSACFPTFLTPLCCVSPHSERGDGVHVLLCVLVELPVDPVVRPIEVVPTGARFQLHIRLDPGADLADVVEQAHTHASQECGAERSTAERLDS